MGDRQRFLGGVALGAGLVFLLDPELGARRRARLGDRARRIARRAGGGTAVAMRDLRNRASGALAEARARRSRVPVEEVVLVQRVRSEIGHVASRPAAIEVVVQGGAVWISGPVPADEIGPLLDRVAATPGVWEVHNALEVSEAPDAAPRGAARPARRALSPARRLGLGLAGSLLALQGMRTRGAVGAVLRGAGLGLVARGLSGATAGAPGRGSRRHAIEVRKTLTVAARVDEVWALWSDFENFPRFMRRLDSVRRTGEGRSRWVAAGPAGLRLEWDAVTTEWEPERLIAWESVPGSPVANEGVVRFEPLSDERTRIEIRLAYTPPAGVVGHALATLAGADAKRMLDEDMLRLKSLLEDGKASVGRETVTRDEVAAPTTTPPPSDPFRTS
jgi:uncharacterized membrane protein